MWLHSDMKTKQVNFRLGEQLKEAALRHVDGVIVRSLAHALNIALFEWLQARGEEVAKPGQPEKKKDERQLELLKEGEE